MPHSIWIEWYSNSGWLLWLGMGFLGFSSLGNWRYTYRVHRRNVVEHFRRDVMNVLDERYAQGEIKHEEYIRIKTDILSITATAPLKIA